MSMPNFEEKVGADSNIFHSIGPPPIKGFLGIWILSMLEEKSMNGYEILKGISEATGRSWEPQTGSIYPLLHKLQKKGLIKAHKAGERHKISYTLTPKGRVLIKNIRGHITDHYKKHVFRRIIESFIWPEESQQFEYGLDSLHEQIINLRSGKLSEKEKLARLARAVGALK